MRPSRYAWTLLGAMLGSLLVPLAVRGQEAGDASASGPAAALRSPSPSADAQEDNTVRLVLHPAAEARAALRHRLLPNIVERIPGNAALDYARLAARWNERTAEETEPIWEWVGMPLEALPRERVRSKLASFRQELEDLKLAGRRETCDWQLPPAGQWDFSTLSTFDVQPIRHLAMLLALEARLEIAEGRFDDALETLQAGYAMVRHLGGGPLLIHAMVGVSISEVMCARVEELVAQPGAPNLYWALTALPRPLIDMRQAMDFEMHWPHLSYAGPERLEETASSAKHWTQFIVRMGGRGARLEDDETLQVSYARWVMRLYPTAKRWLVERGRSPQEVEAMPVEDVVGLWMMEPYVEERDRLCKWFYLPYWQAREGVKQAEQDYRRECEKVSMQDALLLHTVGAVGASIPFARDRNERTIAVLRAIEAIRMYGAAHGARLPEKLGDCEVPVPLNPLSGRPFRYEKRGETAILEASPEDLAGDRGLRYDIRFAR